MKLSAKKYELMIMQLNLNNNKKVFGLVSLIAFVLSFGVIMLVEKDIYFSIVISVMLTVVIYIIMRKRVVDSTKKNNCLDDIVEIDQIIYENKIVEKVLRKDNVETKNEYWYKDMAFVKEDKRNFYLYLNKGAAIVVVKNNLASVDKFKKVLKGNNLVK